MSARFYLFIPEESQGSVVEVIEGADKSGIELIWIYEDVNHDLKLAKGTVESAAQAALNHTVTVVLPGENILTLSAVVPGKNIRQIRQAIPYILEENLIDDVDELHFALKKKINNENEYEVGVINNNYLKDVITFLEKAGIQTDRIIADYSLLQSDTMLFDAGRLLANSSKLKFALQTEKGFQLSTLCINDGDFNKLASFVDAESDAGIQSDNVIQQFDALKIEVETVHYHPYLYLVKHDPDLAAVNLLQGAYKKKKNWLKTGKIWLPAVAAFSAWILIESILFITSYVSLANQNEALNKEIALIYKNTFPSSKNVSNPQARMESQLLNLKKRQGQAGQGFSKMLADSAEILSKTPGLKIKTLRYYDGQINLELKVASLQVLDSLKLQLINDKGFQVEIKNASSEKENVNARIQITGATS